MRKYAELSNELKQHFQVEVVYTLPVTTSSTGVIPRMSSSDYTYRFAVYDHTKILNTCNTESS
jgi:hypothetical protein